MKDYTKLDRYLDANMDASLEELKILAAQPSVAAQNWGIAECAVLVSDMLRERGFTVDIMPTNGSPVVIAERTCAPRNVRSSKTLIFYNHYDVQPPEPLELWESPAFDPQIRDGKIFARGISDDKGHFVSRLFAIDALLAENGDLPCNIKFLVEGEEEIGSVHLPEFVREHKERLAADACIWEFGEVDFREVPMQYTGMRGICYVELSVETAGIDVHSGIGGSIFPNAAWRLVWALNTIKTPDERIQLPGHYDSVVLPTQRDRQYLSALPEIAEDYKERFGVNEFLKGMQGGVDLRIAEVFEPTATICGLTSGYQGPGTKTVLPARASAKIDFRLVPDQTPEQVVSSLRAHLDEHGFQDVHINYLGGEAPGRTDPDDPFIQMVVRTAEPVYGMPMQIKPMVGGSGPNHAFLEHLKLPIATAGIGYPGSKAHAPNENVRLDLYLKGAKHIVRILTEFGQI
jgi:acetylornithine deacetylase/succinyl-diaminopimelate desuccinylase-like protein